jgi:protein-S-isoprenylcysteine O-methyltransferase Ste14
VLFIAAMALGLAGPLLAVTGVVPADPQPRIAAVGLILALAGFVATLAGQTGMGASWRIGVDPGERTELVTTGVFAYIRNPIFTAMMLAQFGMVLLVPTWLSAIGLAALVVAVELQVRAVEETYLRLVHGEAYADYAGPDRSVRPWYRPRCCGGRNRAAGDQRLTRPPDRLVAACSARQDCDVWALPAPFEALPGLHRCGCCGGVYRARSVTQLAATPGTSICRDCARSSARRTLRRAKGPAC